MSNRVGSLYYEVLLNDKTAKGRKAIANGARELTAFLKKQRKDRISDVDKLHSEHARLIAAAQVMFKDDAKTRKSIEEGITLNLSQELAKRDAIRKSDFNKQKQAANEAHAFALEMLRKENIERFNARQQERNGIAEKERLEREANEKAKRLFNEYTEARTKARIAREAADKAEIESSARLREGEKLNRDKRSIADRKANEKAKQQWAEFAQKRIEASQRVLDKEKETAAYLNKVKYNSLQDEKKILAEEDKIKSEKIRMDGEVRRSAKFTADTRVIEERKANEKAKQQWADFAASRTAANNAEQAKARSNAAYLARVRIASARMEHERIEELQLAHQRRMESIRKRMGQASIFGEGGWLSRASGRIGNITMALFPLYVAWMAVSRAITAAKDAFMAFINAADAKKLQTLRLAALNNGDIEIAKGLRQEMVEYAKATAFSVEETMDLAVRVRALGVETENISDVVKVFGRLSLGNSTSMQRLVKAYTDVVGMGRLLQTEVKQFAQSGLNIKKWLMQVYGIDDQAELTKMISDGVVSAQDVEKALKLAYDAYGPLEFAQLETFAGQWSVLTEGWQEFMAEVTNSKWLVDMMRDLNTLLDLGYRTILKLPSVWNEAAMAARVYMGIVTLGMSEVSRLVWHAAKGAMALVLSLGGTNDLEAIIQTMIALERGMQGGVSPLGDFGADADNSKQIEASRAIVANERERLEIVKERHRAELEAIRGDDTRLRQLEARNELQKEYEESMKRTKDAALDMDARREAARDAMYERYEFMLDSALAQQENIEAKRGKHLADRLEKALQTSMPGKMRQDSVEEWVYLKSKRDEADKERRAEARWEKGQDAEERRQQELIQGITEGFAEAMGGIDGSTTNITGI